MMAAPKTLVDVRLAANLPLSAVERTALRICQDAAAKGEPITQDIIREAVGSVNFTGSTSAHILNRLEEKGYITRTFYQRGVQVCIKATGQCTLPPRNTAPHWRHRTESAPAPTIQTIRERSQSVASWMEARARREGKSLHEFAIDCVYAGALAIMAEEEGE
jgi:hypothetical protein